MPFFLIFIIIPFTELYLFATVSEHIGIWTTLGLAFLTAIMGGGLVKHQGLQTIMSMRGSMDQGQMPVGEIFDGFCIVAAGALLITPGFLTDTIGFALLLPPFRKILQGYLKNNMNWSVHTKQTRRPSNPDIIEGEFEHVDPAEETSKHLDDKR